MAETWIEDLRTNEDVVAFCKKLLELKKLGPRSIRFLVAVTMDREAIVREPNGEREQCVGAPKSTRNKSMAVRRSNVASKQRRTARPSMR